MESKYIERALAMRAKGYNCAQSVACTFSDVVGKSEEEMFALSEAFGGGMGGRKSTCGAVSGAVLVVSMLTSKGTLDAGTKETSYERASKIVDEFLAKNKSLVCDELRGNDPDKTPQLCQQYVLDTVGMLQELLQKM